MCKNTAVKNYFTDSNTISSKRTRPTPNLHLEESHKECPEELKQKQLMLLW